MQRSEESLRLAVARHTLGQILPEDLPDVAVGALLRGLDSPSLAALAGATRATEPEQLHALFKAGIRELGFPTPSRVEAATVLKRAVARRVVEGSMSPTAGALEIVRLYRQLQAELPDRQCVGDGFGVSEVVAAHYELDDVSADDADSIAQIAARVVRACAAIAAEDDS